MPRVLTDFNDIDEAGAVTALMANIDGPWNMVLGNRVLLYDDGEHEAWGRVVEIGEDVIAAEIDWDTWGPAGRYRVELYGGWAVGTMYSTPSPVAIGTIATGVLSLPSAPSATNTSQWARLPDLQPA